MDADKRGLNKKLIGVDPRLSAAQNGFFRILLSLRGLMRLIASISQGEMRDRIEFLSSWT